MGPPPPQAEGPLRGGGSTSRPVICKGRAGACPCRPQTAKSPETIGEQPRRADAIRPYAQGKESLPVGRTGGEQARSGAHCAPLPIRGGQGPGRAQSRFSVGAAISRPQRTAMGSPTPQAEGPLRGGGSTSRPVICIGRAGACPCRPQTAKSPETMGNNPVGRMLSAPTHKGRTGPVGRTLCAPTHKGRLGPGWAYCPPSRINFSMVTRWN